jgi:hypothetical protein
VKSQPYLVPERRNSEGRIERRIDRIGTIGLLGNTFRISEEAKGQKGREKENSLVVYRMTRTFMV